MFATSILTPVASGFLSTVNLDSSTVKASAFLGLVGAAVGLSVQAPQVAVQAVLPPEDVSIGSAFITFGGYMGSALWMCVSSTLFTGRLAADIQRSSPGTNVTMLETAGLSDIRKSIGSNRLGAVLAGYNQAVVQTLYVPVALAVLTIIGSLAMERKSIKKKTS